MAEPKIVSLEKWRADRERRGPRKHAQVRGVSIAENGTISWILPTEENVDLEWTLTPEAAEHLGRQLQGWARDGRRRRKQAR